MKKRADAEYFLNVLMFHETFLYSVHWSTGKSTTHRIIANIYFNNKRKNNDQFNSQRQCGII